MAGYKLLIKASAGKEIEGLNKADCHRVIRKIQTLAAQPRGSGCEKLAGYADRYRIRQGSYRIVYLIDDAKSEVTIYKVAHRKDVYR